MEVGGDSGPSVPAASVLQSILPSYSKKQWLQVQPDHLKKVLNLSERQKEGDKRDYEKGLVKKKKQKMKPLELMFKSLQTNKYGMGNEENQESENKGR